MDKPELWPIFICYRQVDGLATARRIYEILHQQRITGPEGQSIELDVYLDRAVPGVADWTKVHRPYLEKARALIVICTPGSRLEEGAADHVHREIDWWMDNREVAPILVDPLEQGTRFIPRQIFERWPDIHRIAIVEDQWTRLSEAELKEKSESVRQRVIGAILPSGARIYVQELEQERRRARHLRVALAVSVVFLAVALIAGGLAIHNSRVANASRLDAIAAELFTQSRLLDIRVESEVARRLSISKRLADSEENATRRTNLENELQQIDTDLGTLKAQRSESISTGLAILNAADTAWNDLTSLESALPLEARTRPEPPYVFSVELLNAGSGESLIVYYGLPDRLQVAMINGGPRRSYRDLVEARLREIADSRFGGGPVPITVFVAGDRDEDKTGGLLRLLEHTAEARLSDQASDAETQASVAVSGAFVITGFGQLVDIQRIWANIFTVQGESSWFRHRIRKHIDELGIPFNEPFDAHIARPNDGRVTVVLPGELRITVLGPAQDRIDNLYRHAAREAERRNATIEPLKAEAFSQVEIAHEPLDLEHDAVAIASSGCIESENARQRAGGSYRDRSVSNLASIVLLIQYRNKSFLFTGDSRGDLILEGLESAGLLDSRGEVQVDLMSIPHLGSDHNVTVDFFRQVRASDYLFSGDGTHDNPEIATIAALIHARGCDPYRMYLANRDGSDDEHGGKLDEFFAAEQAYKPNYRRIFRSAGQRSVIVDLLDPVRY